MSGLSPERIALARAAVSDLLIELDRLRRVEEALRSIESMAGAAGSGETPAMPLAKIARDALAGVDSKE